MAGAHAARRPVAQGVAQAEKVLFWRPIGAERALFSSRYLALCITNERILLLDLGGSAGWFFALGVIGYFIGKRIAQNKAQGLREFEPGRMLANAPGSESVARSDIREVKLHRSRLTIATHSRGSRTFTFDKLKSTNGAGFRAAIEVLTNARPATHVSPPA